MTNQKNSKKNEKAQPKKVFSIILKNYDRKWLRRRLARRAQTLYVGRTNNQIKRTEKLTNILAYHGMRKRMEDVIFDIKIRIKEAFRPLSSADFLENLLIRLEPALELREIKRIKRKHSNRRFQDRRSFIVVPASPTRRIRLGLNFFIKAVHLHQKRFQFTLATAMMLEIVCIVYGLRSYALRLKRDHIKQTKLFFNRFGSPVFEDTIKSIADREKRKQRRKRGYHYRFFRRRRTKLTRERLLEGPFRRNPRRQRKQRGHSWQGFKKKTFLR